MKTCPINKENKCENCMWKMEVGYTGGDNFESACAVVCQAYETARNAADVEYVQVADGEDHSMMSIKTDSEHYKLWKQFEEKHAHDKSFS